MLTRMPEAIAGLIVASPESGALEVIESGFWDLDAATSLQGKPKPPVSRPSVAEFARTRPPLLLRSELPADLLPDCLRLRVR